MSRDATEEVPSTMGLLREVVTGLAHSTAAAGAMVQAADRLTAEVAGLAKQNVAMLGFLARLATAEEARVQDARAAEKVRAEWTSRLIGHPAIQMLLVGIIIAMMQALGVGYL